MSNERKTESIVEGELRDLGYTDINYQGSEDKNIQSKLKSKSGNKVGRGKPEYTIKLNGIASDLLVIECKKNKQQHSSSAALGKQSFTKEDIEQLDAKKYAVDGILHYMSSLVDHYNVVGVAISGTKEEELEISTFISKNGIIEKVKNNTLLNAQGYINLLKSPAYKMNEEVIVANIQKELPILHNELRDKMKLSEQEKPILISACLIALQNTTFKNGFRSEETIDELADFTYGKIESHLTNTVKVPKDKVELMMGNFLFIKNNINVKKHLKFILEKVCFLFDSFSFSNTSYDIIGNFYNEFLKYTGGDQQGLGIVLTPKHITDLFCELGELDVNSVVLDTCTGTGAFLISAMKHMIEKANGDETKIEEIKKNQLIGVEQNPQMFTLACSNMILRHDGKSNMINGSCFSEDVHKKIKALKPNVCLINPPYSQSDSNESELSFINNALNLLEVRGKLIAIVPLSSAIEQSNLKKEQRKDILKEHTLDAVFTMPGELFYPVGTHTCVMVFTAKKPHGTIEYIQVPKIQKKKKKKSDTDTQEYETVEVIKANKPTYFGYWKDDGFVKTKTMGRCDKFKKWDDIKSLWLDKYKSKEVVDGLSAKEKVSEQDEWCCEAYMKIDYSKITEEDFDKELVKLLAFELLNKPNNKKKNEVK